MTLERLKKPNVVVQREPENRKLATTVGGVARVQPATPAQLQRAKAQLEQSQARIQRDAEQASLQRQARAVIQEQARVQRLQDQAVAREQQARVQRAQELHAKQQNFFSSFIKSPVQRKNLEGLKNSSIQAANARASYQATLVPELVQRLVDDRMSLQSQASQAAQPKNALTVRAEWFNTELPVLRAQHNHPSTPFLDGPSVIKPTDQQAFALGKTYTAQRLSSGLTPKDAASAILNIQRKADRDFALGGLLAGINPRQSDYSSIQRLVAEGEQNLEMQRQALFTDDGIQAQALQLATTEANPTTPNSGISEKIKAKLGAGSPLPENVRHQLEAGLNTNLESVRVHTDTEADQLAKSVNAIAFTTGKDIFFQTGTYEPNTNSGYELLAHEVTHTVQQASGQVSPGIDASPQLETEARAKGTELAARFDPNAKPKPGSSFKNLENRAQPNSPLLSSQPVIHRMRLEAMQRSNLEVQLQREPSQTKTTPTAETNSKEPKGTPLNLRGAAFSKDANVKLRNSMDTSSKANIVQELKFGTTFLITEQITSWYRIKLDSGETGFVAAQNISVAPDAKATFYEIKPGDNAIDIASHYFKAKIGLDLRFYVGVLAKLNPKSIKMPSDQLAWGDESSVVAWKNANPMVGFYIWIPSQAYAEALKGTVNNGRLLDHPLEAAAEIGKSIVKKTIKELGGEEVIETLEAIGSNVRLVWDDPGAFMDNLQKSFSQGFHNFQDHFESHLEHGVMDWLHGALGAGFDIPKKADTAGLLSVGLQVVGLDYKNNLRPMLESSLPNGGLAQLEASGGVLQDVAKTGSLSPVISLVESKGSELMQMAAELPTTIMSSLKDFAIKSIITAGIKKLLTMLVPGGGLVQAAINIYNAVMFFIERAKQIGKFLKSLTSSFASIAKGDIKGAVQKIEDTLGNGFSLALGFLASAAGLTKIASSIKAALAKIQAPIKKVLERIAAWFSKMFSSLVKKVTPGSKPSTAVTPTSSGKTTTDPQKPVAPSSTVVSDHVLMKPIEINGDVTADGKAAVHNVWAEIKAGQPIMMMASTPKEIIAHLQDFKADARQKLAVGSPEFKTVSDQISASGKEVGKGIAQMRNVLKTNPRARNTSSDKVKSLPESKVSSDADLSKIAVNTLQSVKQHMEIAFPILNHAGMTVENLKQAVDLAGGIVQFMKGIAAGKTLSGIDRKKLGELWNQKTNGKLDHRAELKNMFRRVLSGNHEWIPTDLMLEVIDRDMEASKVGEIPEWIDLQNVLRTENKKVIFSASRAENHTFNNTRYAVFQGHVGSNIYLGDQDPITQKITYVQQFVPQSKFHNELRVAFRNSLSSIRTCKDTLKNVATDWIWDGASMPLSPLHPLLAWDDGGGTKIDIHQDPGFSQFKTHGKENHKEIFEIFK